MENSWPGNVRELRNHVRRLCILGSLENNRTADGSGGQHAPVQDKHLQLKEFMDETEKAYIIEALRKNRGQVGPTYEQLGISRKSFYDKINKYVIDLSEYRKPVGKG
jgi:two-component system, NtrC family, C4-dicarboxylate transport response regulator DctD